MLPGASKFKISSVFIHLYIIDSYCFSYGTDTTFVRIYTHDTKQQIGKTGNLPCCYRKRSGRKYA